MVFELEITEVVGFYLVSELYSCNENLLRFCSVPQIFIKCCSVLSSVVSLVLCAEAGGVRSHQEGRGEGQGEQQEQSQPDWL